MTEIGDLYQEVILDHYKAPRNKRKPGRIDRQAEGRNPLCGDKVVVFIHVDGELIRDIGFDGSGCAISTASASLMTESVKGKSVTDAQALFKRFHGLVTSDRAPSETAPALGKLEAFSGVREFPVRVKCASLAWHTLQAALEKTERVVSTEEDDVV